MTRSSGNAEAGRWRRRRIAYYCGLGVLFAAIAFYAGPNLILFGKLTWLAPADFVPTARERCLPIVRAMKEYQRDRGVLPQSVEQLVPGYLPVAAPGAMLRDGEFNYWTATFNHEIVYKFAPAEEGWYVRGEFVSGRIPLAPVVVAAPTTTAMSTTTALPATRP
jgi:hypothetical protein